MFDLKAFKLLALDNFAGGILQALLAKACSQFLVPIVSLWRLSTPGAWPNLTPGA